MISCYAMLSRFSRVWLCATPQTAAHQAPPSPRSSRQEHWSGFPFPSPMHESEKWKGSRSVVSDSQRPHGLQPTRLLRPWDTGVGFSIVTQSYLTLCNPMDSLQVCSVHGILQARIPKWDPFPSPGDLPNPGIEPRSSALQADSLLSGASLVAHLVKN